MRQSDRDRMCADAWDVFRIQAGAAVIVALIILAIGAG